MRAGRTLIGTHVLAAGILACNLQGGQPSEPALPGTIPTQVLTVLAPTEMPASPTQTAVAGVKVSVTSDTNCRTGPAKVFDLSFLAHPGTEFNVVGKNSPTGYWIVDNPAGGTCWLWGEYAVVNGDFSNLPEYPSPKLPTPASTHTPNATQTPEPPGSVPNAPSNLKGVRSCQYVRSADAAWWSEKVVLRWEDNSDNEEGFKFRWNGSTVFGLEPIPKDIRTYQYTLTYYEWTGAQLFDEFSVEAFNSAGPSARATTDIPRCP